MSQKLNVTTGFSTLKNKPYDIVEMPGAGIFKTNIDFTNIGAALTETPFIELYEAEDAGITLMNGVFFIS